MTKSIALTFSGFANVVENGNNCQYYMIVNAMGGEGMWYGTSGKKMVVGSIVDLGGLRLKVVDVSLAPVWGTRWKVWLEEIQEKRHTESSE